MAPTGDNSLVVTIVLLSLILVVVIGVFVWNITLVNRTSLVTDQYTTIVQECIADGLNADTLDHPTLAAIASGQQSRRNVRYHAFEPCLVLSVATRLWPQSHVLILTNLRKY